MWQPPLPNKGKVKVTIFTGVTDFKFFDTYDTLDIAAVIDGAWYLSNMYINGKAVTPMPKLYLDEYITDVLLDYAILEEVEIFGFVIESYGHLSFVNYLPQLAPPDRNVNSFPRSFIYKGIKIGTTSIYQEVLTYSVDLDKEDLVIWKNGIKFTGRLNRDKKFNIDGFTVDSFDFIKAEFYGELLPPKIIDDYIELKPKGD